MITKRLKNPPLRKEKLLDVCNVHVAGCGKPPTIDASGQYLGYFENQYGEQWVFIGKGNSAVIRGGDCEWQREYKVTADKPMPDCVVNPSEMMWMVSCMMALTGKSFAEVAAAWDRCVAKAKAAFRKKAA